MAEPLKNRYGAEVVHQIAGMLRRVSTTFPATEFAADALTGYDELSLMQRGDHIAHALHRHLPSGYPKALKQLMKSVQHALASDASDNTMGSFLYLPHTRFIAMYGLDHPEPSLQALHLLTQRFTAEFSIRAFLEHRPADTLATLEGWAADASPDVRRLVSEGTRPRLPWASRLKQFQRDPTPVLKLLELLKDDPELYVRRSVANNLNDIGKDHPELLITIARRWQTGATPERLWIIRHALRHAIKRADPKAFDVLGFDTRVDVEVRRARITPKKVAIGEKVSLAVDLHNTAKLSQRLLVDYQVHYVKANGAARAKVFRWTKIDLAGGDSVSLTRQLSLGDLTTRKHYAGKHQVDLVVNGRVLPIGQFVLSTA